MAAPDENENSCHPHPESLPSGEKKKEKIEKVRRRLKYSKLGAINFTPT
jgi:hypothetical protein